MKAGDEVSSKDTLLHTFEANDRLFLECWGFVCSSLAGLPGCCAGACALSPVQGQWQVGHRLTGPQPHLFRRWRPAVCTRVASRQPCPQGWRQRCLDLLPRLRCRWRVCRGLCKEAFPDSVGDGWMSAWPACRPQSSWFFASWKQFSFGLGIAPCGRQHLLCCPQALGLEVQLWTRAPPSCALGPPLLCGLTCASWACELGAVMSQLLLGQNEGEDVIFSWPRGEASTGLGKSPRTE